MASESTLLDLYIFCPFAPEIPRYAVLPRIEAKFAVIETMFVDSVDERDKVLEAGLNDIVKVIGAA